MKQFNSEQVESDVQLFRNAVESGDATPEQLESILEIQAVLANASDSEWVCYDKLVQHLPNDQSGLLPLVIKGHLLIEHLVDRFIESRLYNVPAFRKANLSFFKKSCLGESLCLPSEESAWLWEQIRELNTIRNKFAHTLETDEFKCRIDSFVRNFSQHESLHEITISSVICRLYGMLKALCEISENDCPVRS